VVTALLRPWPNRSISMATGPHGSTYALAGERYRPILARDGVKLILVPTNGAVDNVRLLRDAHSGVDVGFVQAGSTAEGASQELQSLGTVFYEAVWFFCRCPSSQPLHAGPGWRVSIGPPGSADRPLALKLLALNGVDPRHLQVLGYPPEQARRALLAQELDAAFILSGWDSDVVQDLARQPDISLRSFARADAYVALEPTLNKLTLPQGVADLATNRPAEDTALIASKASLAVRKDVHPALQYLLVKAAMEVHSRPGMFHRSGEFPSAEEIDLPLSDEARQIYRSGPSFLQRSLPFWLAVLVQRLLILVLPLAGIIYPLWSLLPRLYNWQMQSRVNRMFGELKALERELRAAPADARSAMIARLDVLDRRAIDLKIPAAFTERTFSLRAYIRALRERAVAGAEAVKVAES
jgi:TRAP-type uncharacterized transport system substrate-binding protein